jgi:hypothetical protein
VSIGVEDRSLRLLHGLIVSLQIGDIPRALEAITSDFKVSLWPSGRSINDISNAPPLITRGLDARAECGPVRIQPKISGNFVTLPQGP